MCKYSVIWTKNAQFDLELIIEYIKPSSKTIAKDIFFEIKKILFDKLRYNWFKKRLKGGWSV
jgi:hypothetical protein